MLAGTLLALPPSAGDSIEQGSVDKFTVFAVEAVEVGRFVINRTIV